MALRIGFKLSWGVSVLQGSNFYNMQKFVFLVKPREHVAMNDWPILWKYSMMALEGNIRSAYCQIFMVTNVSASYCVRGASDFSVWAMLLQFNDLFS